jgi:GT2 family glycosyltransferase
LVPREKAVLLKMRVTAVIPNWNGAGRLEHVLADLQAQTERLAATVVVDNGSTDSSADDAERAGAKVLRFGTNFGFAVAVNRGVAESSTDLVAILNNDIRFGREWLTGLLSGLGNAPFATGKLLSLAAPEILDGSFDAICRGGCAWRCGQGRADGPAWSQPRDISFPPFTAILVRRDFFLQIGGLDEALGTYLEDVDFGLRCASKGYTGRYVPSAVAYHAGSSTLGRWSPITVRYISRNQLLLLARHYPTKLLLRFGWPIAVAQLLWGLVALKHGAGLAWVLGKIDGLRMFAAYRRVEGEPIAAVLGSSEKELEQLQQQTGWDWYWRLYFALT